MSSFSTGMYGSTIGGIVNSVNDAFSGKTSGIDVRSAVSSLMQVERQPEVQLQQQQSAMTAQISALTTISSQLSALYQSVNELKDFNGAFSQMATGSSDSAIVSASADSTAVAGTHTVVVSKLATISSSYSDYLSSASSLAGAQIVVKYGGDPDNPAKTETINLASTDTTLQKAATEINNGGYGVTANIVTDRRGSRLVLVSKTSGADGNLTVSSPGTSFTGAAGVDAQVTVDGVPFDSSTNTMTGAISGVTLSLGAANPGESVLISVQPDTNQASEAIQTFVTAYNTIIGSINSQYSLDASGNEGLLAGDSMLRTLQSQLLGVVSTSVSGVGQYVNLQSMGIEMQNDATLQINAANLSKALSSNYGDVQKFFQSASPAGWGQLAGTQMLNLISPTRGPVAVDITGLQQSNNSLTDQIQNFEVRMASVQDRLTAQYSSLNALLQQYPLLMQQIAAQLTSLPSTNTKEG